MENLKTNPEIERLKSYINNSETDSIYLHDIDGKFRCVNETAYKTLGYTKKEFLNMDIRELDVSVEESLKYHINDLMHNGSICYESSQYCKDGSKLEIEINTSIMESKSNKLVLSIVKDITPQSIDKFENVQKYYDMVNKTSPSVLIENMGLITHVNNNFCDLLGYSKEELLGHELIDILTGIQEFSILDEMIKVKNGGKSTLTSKIQRKNGSIILTLTKSSPLYNKEGEYKGNISIYNDITELRKILINENKI